MEVGLVHELSLPAASEKSFFEVRTQVISLLFHDFNQRFGRHDQIASFGAGQRSQRPKKRYAEPLRNGSSFTLIDQDRKFKLVRQRYCFRLAGIKMAGARKENARPQWLHHQPSFPLDCGLQIGGVEPTHPVGDTFSVHCGRYEDAGEQGTQYVEPMDG